jgi:hypothetical protein
MRGIVLHSYDLNKTYFKNLIGDIEDSKLKNENEESKEEPSSKTNEKSSNNLNENNN